MSERSQREKLIVQLLRNLDLAGARSGDQIRGGTSSATPGLPHETRCRIHRSAPPKCDCWLRSVAELQRCLRMMYREERRLFRAVYERFVVCDRRPRTVRVKASRPVVAGNVEVIGLLNGQDLNRRGDGETRVLVEVWRADVRAADVDAGVAWLAGVFRGPLQVPVELLEAA